MACEDFGPFSAAVSIGEHGLRLCASVDLRLPAALGLADHRTQNLCLAFDMMYEAVERILNQQKRTKDVGEDVLRRVRRKCKTLISTMEQLSKFSAVKKVLDSNVDKYALFTTLQRERRQSGDSKTSSEPEHTYSVPSRHGDSFASARPSYGYATPASSEDSSRRSSAEPTHIVWTARKASGTYALPITPESSRRPSQQSTGSEASQGPLYPGNAVSSPRKGSGDGNAAGAKKFCIGQSDGSDASCCRDPDCSLTHSPARLTSSSKRDTQAHGPPAIKPRPVPRSPRPAPRSPRHSREQTGPSARTAEKPSANAENPNRQHDGKRILSPLRRRRADRKVDNNKGPSRDGATKAPGPDSCHPGAADAGKENDGERGMRRSNAKGYSPATTSTAGRGYATTPAPACAGYADISSKLRATNAVCGTSNAKDAVHYSQANWPDVPPSYAKLIDDGDVGVPPDLEPIYEELP